MWALPITTLVVLKELQGSHTSNFPLLRYKFWTFKYIFSTSLQLSKQKSCQQQKKMSVVWSKMIYWKSLLYYLCIDPIHKWRLFYFCSIIVQISLPSLTLEQEFFLIWHMTMRLGRLICTRTKELWIGSHLWIGSIKLDFGLHFEKKNASKK